MQPKGAHRCPSRRGRRHPWPAARAPCPHPASARTAGGALPENPPCPLLLNLASAPPGWSEFLLPDLHDELGVGPARALGVDAGVGADRGLQVLVPEELADQLEPARILIEVDLCSDVAELVRGQLDAEAAAHRFADRQGESGLLARH